MVTTATDARALAKATGAAMRLSDPARALARLADPLGGVIALQANAVLEELDLLRHYLREALLTGAIAGAGPLRELAIPPEVEAALDEADAASDASSGCYVVGWFTSAAALAAWSSAMAVPGPATAIGVNKKRSGASRRGQKGDQTGDQRPTRKS